MHVRRVLYILLMFPIIMESIHAEQSDKLLDNCEKRIRNHLKSPKSYERVSVDKHRNPMNRGEYLSILLANVPGGEFTSDIKAKMELYDAERLKPVNIALDIHFDASNAYGVMLRSYATCIYPSLDGTEDGASIIRSEFEIK